MTPKQRIEALKVEADRLKARLDQFDKQISGDPDAWVSIVARMPDDVAEVVVDKLLTEARQTALAYATVVKTLAQLGDGAREAPTADPLDMLALKRDEKIRAAQAK